VTNLDSEKFNIRRYFIWEKKYILCSLRSTDHCPTSTCWEIVHYSWRL